MPPAALFSEFSALALTIMVAGALAASLARGYTGFGYSALLVASWSLVMSPARAVAVALVMEVVASILQAVSIWRSIPWRQVGFLLLGAACGTPAGVWLLAQLAPERMRLVVAVFVLIAAIALLAGVRLKARAGDAGTAAVGLVSGVANGAVAMGGLPVAIFLTAGGDNPFRIRAALIAYFFLLDLMGLGFFAQAGLLGGETFAFAAFAFPLLVAGMWYGTRRFFATTVEKFRRTTLWVLIALALIGLVRSVT
jgi:uncharacterized membrane protein YfcA